MALVVQKYGGSSVDSTDRIRAVARRVADTRRAGHEVVVVVSAMGDTTDDLLELAGRVTAEPLARELDMLLSSGERVSNSLLAMALEDLGLRACSLSGEQAGMITTGAHGRARITEVRPRRVREELARGAVVLVAGFQGVHLPTGDVTTLGRGGSDATAVALAAALKADVCEIYTDVDGVLTADPRIVPNARRLDRLSYEEMLELAASGAKVLMSRCVEYARRNGVPLHVRSAYGGEPGTTVFGSVEEQTVEQALITGVAHDRSVAKVVVAGLPDRPGFASAVFRVLADQQIELDVVVQNVCTQPGRTDLTFTVSEQDGPAAVAALLARRGELSLRDVLYEEHVGKVSLVGAGMRAQPGVAATFCEALSSVGINIEIMCTSEIRISVLCKDFQVSDAVRALHDAFQLGGSEQAVVYAGSGR
ncbi:aspartate kinase [Kutzneria albida]|uniref:Aspartokinase n=1 Tax=Kutzneria albida DSM 43870 TaxID=1449976 RepID=W5VZC1_9PSEU|nr:aspartate kinase [Kutzneria albida]AHH93815.1 Aspartokinase [Kutzneria albida DSM 43870]